MIKKILCLLLQSQVNVMNHSQEQNVVPPKNIMDMNVYEICERA